MSEADKVRRAISNAFEEAEMFDGMSTEDSCRYALQFKSLPDSVLISLGRNIRAIRRDQ